MGCGGSTVSETISYLEDDDWVVAGNDIVADNKFPESFGGYDNKEKLNLPCTDQSEKAECDVFYVHHTSLAGMKGDSMENMRREIECHVSIFNNCCRLYCPNYRAASNNTNLKQINIAYDDIKKAFLHFIKQWNSTRPFFLAGSGQGSYLLLKLIQEVFLDTDTLPERAKELRKRLICAYLPGTPILESDIDKKSFFKGSSNARDIASIVSWHTTNKSHGAPQFFWWPSDERNWTDFTDDEKNDDKRYILVNPITFDNDTSGSSKENNGSMNNDGMLQPRIVGAKFAHGYKIIQITVEDKEYKPPKSDYMAYWMNIRQNAGLRAKIWQNQQLM